MAQAKMVELVENKMLAAEDNTLESVEITL